MSTRTVVECDVPGCARTGAGPYLMVDLNGATGDNLLVAEAEYVRLHICIACATGREGRAFLAARLEKAVTTLRGARS